jgi:acyl-CoA thioester hydrolase
MMRAAGARLIPTAHPFVTEIGTRYADLDPLGHINNVALASIIEDARERFCFDLGVMTLAADHSVAIFGGYRMVVAAAHYEYLAESFHPFPISVHCATLKVGRTSWTTTQLAVQGGRAIGTCETVTAFTGEGNPKEIEAPLRQMLESTTLRAIG